MNVALINKNPTVSRLITLSLNKLGADYIEIDEAGKLDGNFDYIVIDSEVGSDGIDLKAHAAKKSRNLPTRYLKSRFYRRNL